MLKCQELLAFLTIMSSINFLLEHEKSFITSRPVFTKKSILVHVYFKFCRKNLRNFFFVHPKVLVDDNNL